MYEVGIKEGRTYEHPTREKHSGYETEPRNGVRPIPWSSTTKVQSSTCFTTSKDDTTASLPCRSSAGFAARRQASIDGLSSEESGARSSSLSWSEEILVNVKIVATKSCSHCLSLQHELNVLGIPFEVLFVEEHPDEPPRERRDRFSGTTHTT